MDAHEGWVIVLQIKKKPPSLVSLCLGVVGSHLEDIIDDLPEIVSTFPSHIKVKKRIYLSLLSTHSKPKLL